MGAGGLGDGKKMDFHMANVLSIWNSITLVSIMHFHTKIWNSISQKYQNKLLPILLFKRPFTLSHKKNKLYPAKDFTMRNIPVSIPSVLDSDKNFKTISNKCVKRAGQIGGISWWMVCYQGALSPLITDPV